MRLNGVTNYSPNFTALKLTSRGAENLAEIFARNPELEADFMLNIAKPLDECEGYVSYDGFTTRFKGPDDHKEECVVHGSRSGVEPNVLGITSLNYSRQAYRKNSPIEPTDLFRNIYPLNEIEIAKNIVLDKEYMSNQIAVKEYLDRHCNETLAEKAKRLERCFDISI